MNDGCLFCKMVAGSIPTTVVLDTEDVLAFRDINPQAPTHVLVVPKQHYATAGDLANADPALAGTVLAAAHRVAVADGIDDTGYRLVFNSGKDAQQTVLHVHCHVLGGRSFTWPPG
ncbi:MAG: histidine triad nucleotide-binding protein [Sciscionella sp.]